MTFADKSNYQRIIIHFAKFSIYTSFSLIFKSQILGNIKYFVIINVSKVFTNNKTKLAVCSFVWVGRPRGIIKAERGVALAHPGCVNPIGLCTNDLNKPLAWRLER